MLIHEYHLAPPTHQKKNLIMMKLTDEVVPVFVVELGGDGDDAPEEIRHEAQMIHLCLSLDVVLPQPVTPEHQVTT